MTLVCSSSAKTSRRRLVAVLRNAIVLDLFRHPDRRLVLKPGVPTKVLFLEEETEMPVCAFLLGGAYLQAMQKRALSRKAENPKTLQGKYRAFWFEEASEFESLPASKLCKDTRALFPLSTTIGFVPALCDNLCP